MVGRPPYPNPHDYARDQEILRHDDAVIRFGEMSAVAMMWRDSDFRAGLVAHCSRCTAAGADTFNAYKQPVEARCSNCYGTTFEGGIKNLVYRPVLWRQDFIKEDVLKRGVTFQAGAHLELTSDIELRSGDYVIRADGTRWRVDAPHDNEIHTGFGSTPFGSSSRWSCEAMQENETSVAYAIPISMDMLAARGWSPVDLVPTSQDVAAVTLLQALQGAPTGEQIMSGGDASNNGNDIFSGGEA